MNQLGPYLMTTNKKETQGILAVGCIDQVRLRERRTPHVWTH